MRTLILVVFTAFILSLGYMAYWWMQPADRVRVKKGGQSQPALELAKRDTDKPYGPGKRVWVKKFDEDTAKLASRFRADDYTPRNDGWVTVKQPRAQFFMRDGRAILIQGDSGEVIMDDQKDKTGMKAFAGSRDTPSRGRLFNVTIYMYHDVERPEEQLDEEFLKRKGKDQAPHLGMTITLNNASFDNQTFKIYSEGYGRGHNHVEPDQVPVKLVGEDYDFDGKGLVIRWNERDRRLQLLEIAHGEQLVIKHPNAMMKKQEMEEPSVAWWGGGQMRGWGGEGMRGGVPLPVMLAARGRAATGEAIAGQQQQQGATAAPTTRRVRPSLPKPKITPNTDPPLYRAIFHDNVKIVQGQDLVVTGNKMSVDFLMKDQEGPENGPAPATQPGAKGKKSRSTAAATQPTSVAISPTTAPTTQRTARAVARRRAAPTTKPSGEDEKPVIITWTGKLLVEPLAVGPENPIKDGEAVVRIEGTPVTATQQGSTILSGTLTWRTEDQAMLLTPIAPDQPVVMKDTKGSLVHTTRMDFFQPKHQAILYGVSDARFPQEDENGKPGAPLLAKWSKTCTLYFANDGSAGSANSVASGGSMNIERAELDGNVAIDHPQLKLNSDALELAFDTTKGAATRPAALGERRAAVSRALADQQGALAELSKAVPDGNFNAAQETLMLSVDQLGARLRERELMVAQAGGAESAPKALTDDVAKVKGELEARKTALSSLGQNLVKAEELKKQVAQGQADLAELDKQIKAAVPPAPPASRPTTRPAIRSDLKQLVATGTVHCEITDSSRKTQKIDCDRLTMQTATAADGKLYPDIINADGQVHAIDPEQDLRAGHLAVTLRPSTRPSESQSASAELQSMVAHQNVVVISKDGTRTTADQLLVDSKDGKNNVKLLGQPYATIVDKKNTISGPIIEIFPDAQQLQVVGAGNMKGVQEDKTGGAGAERPIDVTWQRGMAFDGRANVVDVTGQVVAVTTDAEGAKNTARGERMRMLLVDAAPTTRPTTRQVAAATTRPAKGPNDAMANKTVREISFDENASVTSVTLADDQTLLRRTHLEAQTVQYDLLAKRMTVPVPGRMVVEDHRPPATKPAPGSAAEASLAGQKASPDAENNRGTTAFQWSKTFTYDDAQHQAVMTGEDRNPVVVVHKDDSPRGQVFRLTGNTVTADLEPAAPTTRPTTMATAAGGPATRPAQPQEQKMQLKRVTGTGHLVFNGPGAEIHALYMEYDPRTHWLVARGNEREMVEFNVASQAGGSRRAEEVQYNLETAEVKSRGVMVRMAR